MLIASGEFPVPHGTPARGTLGARLPVAVRLEATSASPVSGSRHRAYAPVPAPGYCCTRGDRHHLGSSRRLHPTPLRGSSAHRPAPRGFCHGSLRTPAGRGYPSGTAQPHPLSLAADTPHRVKHARDPHRPLFGASLHPLTWGRHCARVGME